MTTETQVMEVTTQNILDPKSALGRMLEKLGRIDYKVKPEHVADLKTRAESVIQSGKTDKDASKLANTIRLEARRHRLDVQKDFKLAKETVKEIVQEISAKTNERGERLIADLDDIETPLQAIEDTFEANKKAEAEKAEAERQKKIRDRFDALGKVNAKFDYVAIQIMSDESYGELLAKAAAEFEKVEADRLERQQAEQQAERARQAKATIGRSRASELAQLGDIVAPEVAAEWDESVYSLRHDDASGERRRPRKREIAKPGSRTEPSSSRPIACAPTLISWRRAARMNSPQPWKAQKPTSKRIGFAKNRKTGRLWPAETWPRFEAIALPQWAEGSAWIHSVA